MKEYKLNDLIINLEIEYKPRNKRIYIRPIKPNIVIIRTPIFLSDNKINEYLNASYNFIKKAFERKEKEIIKSNSIHLFGYEYEIKEIDDNNEYIECDGNYIIIHKIKNSN